MRIYKDFVEAHSEVQRDLAEMGIKVHPHSYQDKIIKDDPDFETMELQDYIYKVLNPRLGDLDLSHPWVEDEFKERIAGAYSGKGVNPGKAWILRREVWEPFLQGDGKFAYTYSQRFAGQLKLIVEELRDNPDSRQLYLGVWDPLTDPYRLGGISRVPCSLGYIFQVRSGVLNITYLMRSCDFVTHFQNDVYLACKLHGWMADEGNAKLGTFTHYIGSLHIFRKDAKGVF